MNIYEFTYEIIKAHDPGKGWYIRKIDLNYAGKKAFFLHKDLIFNHNTGWRSELVYKCGEAPGYYHSAEEAKQYLDAYLYIENLKRSVLIREANFCGFGGWYITVGAKFLWKSWELHIETGFKPGYLYGDAPGYYRSKHEAELTFRLYVESETEKQLNKIKKTQMKIGDTVKITDGSWALKVGLNKLIAYHGVDFQTELWRILAIGCNIYSKEAYRDKQVLNTIVQGVDSGTIAFVLHEVCTPIPTEQNVEIRYFCEGRDVTSELSTQSKRNLRNR